VLVLGDFNLPDIDWQTLTLNPTTHKTMHQTFIYFVCANNLEQLVNFPTHVKGNILDLVLTNMDHLTHPQGDPSFSDHLIISFTLLTRFKIERLTVSPNPTPFWHFAKANTANIHLDCFALEKDITSAIDTNVNVETVWSLLKAGLMTTSYANIPHCMRKKRRNHWLSRECIRQNRKHKRWYKVKFLYPTLENNERLKTQSKLCKNLINRDYNNFINRHVCAQLDKGDSKPLYKFIANKNGSNNTIKQLDGCASGDNIGICERFADAFSSVLTVDNDQSISVSQVSCSQHNPITFDNNGIMKQLCGLRHCQW